MSDSILHNARCVNVVSVYGVRDVSMYKYLTWLAVAYRSLRNTTIRATYPKNLRRLALRQEVERIWVL